MFEPLMPYFDNNTIDNRLLKKAENVLIESASLTGNLPVEIIQEIASLLRIVNSYYSNRIEGQGTHPYKIAEAMNMKFDKNHEKAQLQKLSIRHIQTQEWLEEYITNKNPYSVDVIKAVHTKFYDHDEMNSFLILSDGSFMTPGEFRSTDVRVGAHIPLSGDRVSDAMGLYERRFTQELATLNLQSEKLLLALVSHHRLVWLHPFEDGNGRVGRLLLDAAIISTGLKGYGLWNPSRGMARNLNKYYDTLQEADYKEPTRIDTHLHLDGLQEYIEYMLDLALDQILFMKNNLNISTLSNRISKFVEFSINGMYEIQPLPKGSDLLFNALLVKGSIKKGDIHAIMGISPRKANDVIKTLTQLDYLDSQNQKQPVRLKFNPFFASKIFPNIIPDEIL